MEAPGRGEVLPGRHPGDVLVFRKFFEVGLWFLCSPFICDVLEIYGLEIQQLSINSIVRLAIFEWALWMEGNKPHAAAFAATHRAHMRPQPTPQGTEYVSA